MAIIRPTSPRITKCPRTVLNRLEDVLYEQRPPTKWVLPACEIIRWHDLCVQILRDIFRESRFAGASASIDRNKEGIAYFGMPEPQHLAEIDGVHGRNYMPNSRETLIGMWGQY